MEILTFLTYIAVILLFGLLISLIAVKIRFPRIFILILFGIVLNKIPFPSGWRPEFPTLFIAGIAVLALIIILFDSTSRLKIKQFDNFSLSALKLTIFFFVLCLIILSGAVHFIYKIPLLVSFVFGALMAGTAPEVVLSLLQTSKNKVLQLLEIEALVNTPIIVLFPFIVLDFIQDVGHQFVLSKVLEQLIPFFQQIVTGIGAGIVIGLIVFKAMRKYYSETYSPLAIITAALMTYTLAENLGGNGVLAVTTMGVFFGRMAIKEKKSLQEYSAFFSHILEILVFVLVGFVIDMPLNFKFFIYSFIIFMIFLLIRFVAIYISFEGDIIKGTCCIKERLFMTLNCPKGIAVVVVVLLLKADPMIYAITGIPEILDIALIFVLYSVLLSSLVAISSKYFLGEEIIAKPKVAK